MPNLGVPTRMDTPVTVGRLPMQEAEIPEHILEESEKHNYFIYNVSCWPYMQNTGSTGSKYIPGLDETLVLNEKHHVAGPLVISGQPYETYPGDGHQRVIWHKSRAHGRDRKEWEGHDFALNVCGVGHGLPQGQDLRKRGVFISKIADSYELREASHGSPRLVGYRIPAMPSGKQEGEAWNRYRTFMAEVADAEKALRIYCRDICVRANSFYSSNKFEENRTDQMFQAARFIKGTTAEYPWMNGTGDTMLSNIGCPGCGETIKSGIDLCPKCGRIQISKEQWDSVKHLYPTR